MKWTENTVPILRQIPAPPQSTMEDYESMPIDVFGEAVLRGMGWKKGAAIGKSNKG